MSVSAEKRDRRAAPEESLFSSEGGIGGSAHVGGGVPRRADRRVAVICKARGECERLTVRRYAERRGPLTCFAPRLGGRKKRTRAKKRQRFKGFAGFFKAGRQTASAGLATHTKPTGALWHKTSMPKRGSLRPCSPEVGASERSKRGRVRTRGRRLPRCSSRSGLAWLGST